VDLLRAQGPASFWIGVRVPKSSRNPGGFRRVGLAIVKTGCCHGRAIECTAGPHSQAR
jgi:hypothetical protein